LSEQKNMNPLLSIGNY